MSILSIRLGLRALLVVALDSCFWSASTHAVTSHWNTDASGSFTTAANWDNGVPGSDDTAEFNRGFIAYTVSFPGNSFSPRQHVIDRLVVRTNEVTFVDSPLFVLPPIVTVAGTLPDSIIIGKNAGDVAIANMGLSSLSSSYASIGVDEGAMGTLNVGGVLSLSAVLNVGKSGTGTLNVAGGGHVESLLCTLGVFPNSVGHATITGAGSTWTNADRIYVGSGGTGTLTIDAGGAFSSTQGVIGLSAGSNGTVTVTGAGSSWTNSDELVVGNSSPGMLTIEAGGSVSNLGSSQIGLNGYGTVTVTGAGSTFHSAGDLTIGRQGGLSGKLIVSDGGIASVDGLLIVEFGSIEGNGMADADVISRGLVRPGLWTNPASGALHIDGSYLQAESGRLSVRLGGTLPTAQYDQLQVTGPVTLNGTLTVVLSNSFQPSAGNVFDVIDGSSISGTFSTIQLPALAGGLSWNTTQLYTTGVLSIVSAGVPGDYNNNGVVDAADYVLWRNGGPLQNEVDNPGVVDAADYTAWRARFGNSGSGAGANEYAGVPEPSTLVMLVLATAGMCSRRRRAA